MRPLEEAQREILSNVTGLPVIEVDLSSARGLALAAEIVAPHDVPPFTNSAMDGYAVQAADTVSAPVQLRVLEDVAAGHTAARAVIAGTSIKS